MTVYLWDIVYMVNKNDPFPIASLTIFNTGTFVQKRLRDDEILSNCLFSQLRNDVCLGRKIVCHLNVYKSGNTQYVATLFSAEHLETCINAIKLESIFKVEVVMRKVLSLVFALKATFDCIS